MCNILLINPRAFKLNRVVLPVYSFVMSLNMYFDIFETLCARIDADKDKEKGSGRLSQKFIDGFRQTDFLGVFGVL